MKLKNPESVLLILATANRYRGAWIRHRVLAEHLDGERYLGDHMALTAADIAKRREQLFDRLLEYLGGEGKYEPSLDDVLEYYEDHEG